MPADYSGNDAGWGGVNDYGGDGGGSSFADRRGFTSRDKVSTDKSPTSNVGGAATGGSSPERQAASRRAADAFSNRPTSIGTSARDARRDPNARRDAIASANNPSLTQDVESNLATMERRSVEGYQPSTMDDRRGTAISQGGTASVGSTRAGEVDAARMQATGSFGAKAASLGMGLLGGPLAGLATKSAIGAYAANDMNKAVTGQSLSAGDIMGQAARAAAPSIAGDVGGRIGGALGGAITNSPYGALAGGLIGSNLVSGLATNAMNSGRPGGQSQGINQGGEYQGGESSYAGLLASPAMQQQAPSVAIDNTGYKSSFGNYGSHNAAFTGMRNKSSRALSAWS